MSKHINDPKEIPNDKLISSILTKFEIESLNPMQEEMFSTVQSKSDVVLLSPTGTGKTLAFLLPLIERLDKNCAEIQILILVPARELAQQIEQVARNMGSGFKVNALYGGRAGALDRIDIKHRPAILIGTPGRIADRMRRDEISLDHIKTLVLDEFDKSLEVGFENEMIEIVDQLPNVKQRILTSATSDAKIPGFVGLKKPVFINYLKEGTSQLTIKTLLSEEKDKLNALQKTLAFVGHQPGIVFFNFKDALQRVSDFLTENNISHECFHGGMEQTDRERSLVKFRNGSIQLLLATDLAARGLDIPEIKFIIHYNLPLHKKEFTHRNGRTARMNRDGIAYILQWKDEEPPEFIQEMALEKLNVEELPKSELPLPVQWKTLYISGGRQDKISKGDVAGLFMKQGQIHKDQLGVIELKQNCAYVSVHAEVAKQIIAKTNNTKLKKKKIRVSVV